ncbi:MAG: hypothetical protein M3Q60_13370 [Actinomycetota bacterium]|nr:hypothetical protein [Actinomycetota bacterium]
MNRISLVEDHTSLRQALALVLAEEPGFTVVGQAGSLAEAGAFCRGSTLRSWTPACPTVTG